MPDTSQKDFILLANKNSEGTKINTCLNKIIELLTNFNFNIEVKETQTVSEINELVSLVYKQGKRNFFVAGGDGTLFHFINALMLNYQNGDPVTLGIIPIGTGNALYSSVIAYEENRSIKLRDAILKFKQGHLRNLDLIQVVDIDKRTFYICNMAFFGVGTSAVDIRNKYLNKLGKIGYEFAVYAEVISKNIKNKYNLRKDGKNISQNCSFMGIFNSRYIGNKVDISPFSEIDDGFGEIIFVDYKGKISALKTLSSMEKGEHLFLDNVNYSQFKEINFLENNETTSMQTILDGEVLNLSPKTIKMLPTSIKLFC